MMTKRFLLTILTLSSFVFNCKSNKHLDKQWYKGNLHAHSYWSDGEEFPEMIMDWYKTNGYDFTVLSDHNTLAEGEKWVTVPEKEYLQIAFQKY